MADNDVIKYTRPDGVMVNLSEPPYWVIGYDGFGIGEMAHTFVEPPGAHGAYWHDTRMGAKILTVHFQADREGVTERQAVRREIVRMFNPLLGPGTLRLEQVNGINREIDCILAESLPLPSDDFRGSGSFEAIVRFKSHGIPAFRDPVISRYDFDFVGSPGNFSFPWSFPRIFSQSGFAAAPVIHNDGDIAVPVVITMTGPLLNPVFRNETSGRQISMSGLNLVAGQTLVVDTNIDRYVVQVNGIDVWNYIVDADFWDLEPGDNQIAFDLGGTDATTLGRIEWYTRYLGQ